MSGNARTCGDAAVRAAVAALAARATGAGQHRIVPYDDAWPAQAHRILDRLAGALGDTVVRLDHVGSTSVPGLAARPIIDVQVSVRDVADRALYEPALRSLGYAYFPVPELPAPDYLIYVPADGSNTEHIAVCEAGGHHERRHLAMRAYLRSVPDMARHYEQVKRSAAAAAAGSRAHYSAGKHDAVQAIERRALDWWATQSR